MISSPSRSRGSDRVRLCGGAMERLPGRYWGSLENAWCLWCLFEVQNSLLICRPKRTFTSRIRHCSFAELFTNTKLRRWLKGATSYAPQKQPECVGRSATLTIPELEQSKTAVLNTLASQHSR